MVVLEQLDIVTEAEVQGQGVASGESLLAQEDSLKRSFTRGRTPRATWGGAAALAALRPRHGTCSGGHRCRKLDSGAAALPGGSPPPAPATSRSTSGSFRSPPFSSSLGHDTDEIIGVLPFRHL